jgi:Holliday junction resolvase-like predicted endonuclease
MSYHGIPVDTWEEEMKDKGAVACPEVLQRADQTMDQAREAVAAETQLKIMKSGKDG